VRAKIVSAKTASQNCWEKVFPQLLQFFRLLCFVLVWLSSSSFSIAAQPWQQFDRHKQKGTTYTVAQFQVKLSQKEFFMLYSMI